MSYDIIIYKINNKSQEIIFSKYFNLKNKKIPKFSEVDAFLTVKDHKKDFLLNIEFRTINPSKNLLGKISKNILEKIVTEIKNFGIPKGNPDSYRLMAIIFHMEKLMEMRIMVKV